MDAIKMLQSQMDIQKRLQNSLSGYEIMKKVTSQKFLNTNPLESYMERTGVRAIEKMINPFAEHQRVYSSFIPAFERQHLVKSYVAPVISEPIFEPAPDSPEPVKSEPEVDAQKETLLQMSKGFPTWLIELYNSIAANGIYDLIKYLLVGFVTWLFTNKQQ